MAERVIISERTVLGMATVMQRRQGDVAALAAAIGCPLPDGPRRTTAGEVLLLGTGPGTMLALSEDAGADWGAALQARLAGLASVSDQSSGYRVFRFAGPAAADLLQRGVAIDLHPDVFKMDSVAATVIAHIGVILWRVDAGSGFDVAVFRSFADSFRHWIDVTRAAITSGPHDAP